MNKAKTKYIIVIAGKVYPQGTIVDVLSMDDILVKSQFPNIKSNPNSNQLAVKFPDRNHVSIGLKKSFILL